MQMIFLYVNGVHAYEEPAGGPHAGMSSLHASQTRASKAARHARCVRANRTAI